MKFLLPAILIVGIIGGVYLVQNRVNLFPKAQQTSFQEKIVISNLAPRSLSISYFSLLPSYDFIQYGENTDIPNAAYDTRMKDGLNPQLSTHYFNLKDLKPNTKYYFKINNNGKLWPEAMYLTFKTPRRVRGLPEFKSFSGTVKKGFNGQKPSEAIVFLSSDNGQLLTAPMDEKGEWHINYFGMRTADMSSYYEMPETEQIKFMAYAGKDGFGMFGEYALKKTGIGIEVNEGLVPFYKINFGQQPIGLEGQNGTTPEQQRSQTIWVLVTDFLKGIF